MSLRPLAPQRDKLEGVDRLIQHLLWRSQNFRIFLFIPERKPIDPSKANGKAIEQSKQPWNKALITRHCWCRNACSFWNMACRFRSGFSPAKNNLIDLSNKTNQQDHQKLTWKSSAKKLWNRQIYTWFLNIVCWMQSQWRPFIRSNLHKSKSSFWPITCNNKIHP